MPPPVLVRLDDPTLTTMRRASVTSALTLLPGSQRSLFVLRALRPTRRTSWGGGIRVVLGADLVGRGAGRWPVTAVEPAGHVRALLALGPVGHGLLDRPTAADGGPLLLEAEVLATAGRVLGAGVDARLEVEDDRVVGVADDARLALDGAQLDQLGLDPQPVEPVGQEADRLVVAEVGLPDPPLGLGPAHHPALVTAGDRELGPAVERRRTQDDARRLGHLLRGAGRGHDLGHREGQLAQPFAGRSADREHPQPLLTQVVDDDVGEVAPVRDVDLVERDQPGPVLEAAVAAELVLDRREVVDGVAARLHRSRVYDVYQGGAALDVAEELVAEAAALAGALDQAGDVRDGEGGLAGGDDAQVGDQGGEGVVGDLGTGPRDRGYQAGLAGAREADEADVGDHLELEDDLELVAGLAEQGEAGSLALAAGQRGVAEPSTAALSDHQLGARADQVGEDLAAPVGDHGPVGHRQHQVGAVAPAAVTAGTVAAVLGAAAGAVVVVDQGGHVGVDAQDHRAAGSAGAAGGAAERLGVFP